jgi:hypothetical protein
LPASPRRRLRRRPQPQAEPKIGVRPLFAFGRTKAQATVPKHPGYFAGFSTIKTIVR